MWGDADEDHKPLWERGANEFRLNAFARLCVLFLVALVVIIIYNLAQPPRVREPIDLQVEADLRHEFEMLKPLTGMSMLDKPVETGVPGHSESISYKFYTTGLGEAEIYGHYLEELRAKGWKYYGTGRYRFSNHIGMFHGFSKIYIKGDYFIECYYTKQSSNLSSFYLIFKWQKDGVPVKIVDPSQHSG